MRNVEYGRNPAEQEFSNVEKPKNFGEFIKGLQTQNYTNEEFLKIRSVLGEISREL